MLQIESKSKISNVFSKKSNRGNDFRPMSAWLNSEDVLMAVVFGTSMYLPFKQLLGPILMASKSLKDDERFPVQMIKEKHFYGELWPSFKEIHDYDPNLIDINNDQNKEPDAFCEFEHDILIIEAKRPYAQFNEKQLSNYLEAFQRNKKKSTWLLTVGKGANTAKSLSKFSIFKRHNVLYIDWTTIQTTIMELLSQKDNGNLKPLLMDMNSILSNRYLKPFAGFAWPEGIDYLVKQDQLIKMKWFPRYIRKWPQFMNSPVVFNDMKELPWQKNVSCN